MVMSYEDFHRFCPFCGAPPQLSKTKHVLYVKHDRDCFFTRLMDRKTIIIEDTEAWRRRDTPRYDLVKKDK